ncbi:MAG: sulfatase-like hydrolase/transferase [Anaerolineales bacterium]|nr:sulfatase-like hydrolase/transferase [Anaerolineales bacterium]
MRKELTRRDFLKLASLVPIVKILAPRIPNPEKNNLPNILILLFDAWSAKNVSLYGYPRNTTPYLERLAQKAIVYHNHYAGGYFTVPGTTSLLTGVLAWQHLYFRTKYKLAPYYKEHNLFSAFPEYKRIAYSHNLLANDVLNFLTDSLDKLKPWQELYKWPNPAQSLFFRDNDISSIGWIRTMDTTDTGAASSVFLSRLLSYLIDRANQKQAEIFPLGIPRSGQSFHFILEDAIDWLANFVKSEEEPFLAYYHLFPPHDPYNTRFEYHQHFKDDGYAPEEKPEHFLSAGISHANNLINRQQYDEYLLYVDAEIDRLFALLESTGKLENTWILLTSDHGEIFERGLKAHLKPSFYDPGAKVPLLIFPPGQKNRIDIHVPTSAIDLLPTLKTILGQKTPEWAEGQVLPPFNQDDTENRAINIPDCREYEAGEPFRHASLMLRKGRYKLIHHFGSSFGYERLKGNPLSELYDLENDPEEITNLFDQETELGNALLGELYAKMRELSVKE